MTARVDLAVAYAGCLRCGWELLQLIFWQYGRKADLQRTSIAPHCRQRKNLRLTRVDLEINRQTPGQNLIVTQFHI